MLSSNAEDNAIDILNTVYLGRKTEHKTHMKHKRIGRFEVKTMKNEVIYSRLFGRVVLLPVLRWGVRKFEKSGETGKLSYRAMRKLFGNNDPTLFYKVANGQIERREDITFLGEIQGIASSEISTAVADLEMNGFAVLSVRLEEEKCVALEKIAREAVCSLVDPSIDVHEAIFDAANPIAVRYEISETDLLKSDVVQQIICDFSLLEIAKLYLGCEPVQDLVTMWWSTAINVDASSKAAQQFHFDLDRFKFLKLFIYLTEVNDTNGPHVYIKGSQRNLPRQLRRDGRHDDSSVKSFYPTGEIKITGPRGLVFLADTRGLHKGMPLREGHRLIFQTEYASSLFGYPYLRQNLVTKSEEIGLMAEENPGFLKRFDLN